MQEIQKYPNTNKVSPVKMHEIC